MRRSTGVTASTSARDHLLGRVRAILHDEPMTREVAMFGGRSLMVAEKLLVSALRDGGLLVRVDAARHAELLGLPGAAQATMGPGRDMGPGWIEIAPDALDDERLGFWINTALTHNRAVTGRDA